MTAKVRKVTIALEIKMILKFMVARTAPIRRAGYNIGNCNMLVGMDTFLFGVARE
jgi:hypothetical protein